MVLYPNKLPESERVCSGICTLKTSAYADYIIDDIERYETPDQTYYLFELEKGAKEIEIKIDLSGKLL